MRTFYDFLAEQDVTQPQQGGILGAAQGAMQDLGRSLGINPQQGQQGQQQGQQGQQQGKGLPQGFALVPLKLNDQQVGPKLREMYTNLKMMAGDYRNVAGQFFKIKGPNRYEDAERVLYMLGQIEKLIDEVEGITENQRQN